MRKNLLVSKGSGEEGRVLKEWRKRGGTERVWEGEETGGERGEVSLKWGLRKGSVEGGR